ncbi:unnamed protein product [Microthlaspi erraticum]|uniref:F-box associated beta-propeller type 1 domain-containing protein n=1 Tax=Microthlaspi erraticum TaxID=1685480 RepID=A0A6D2K5I2_9BRAS|nr:unnamed protein product [Microthlaspi erraticum]
MFNGDRRFARKHSDEAAKQFMVLLLRRTLRISPAIVDLDGKAESFTVTASCYAPPPTNLDSWFGTHLLVRPGGSPSYRVTKDRHFALGYYKEGNNKSVVFFMLGLSVVKDEKLSVLLQLTSKTEIWVTNKIETTQSGVVEQGLSIRYEPWSSTYLRGKVLARRREESRHDCSELIDFKTRPKARDMIYIVGEDNEATQVDLDQRRRMDFGQIFFIILRVWFKSSELEAKGKELTCNLIPCSCLSMSLSPVIKVEVSPSCVTL